MTDQWWNDDDLLLEELGRALHAARDVPTTFLEAGRAAYTWHTIDAELAALTYDSAVHDAELAATRAESAALRALTFASAQLTVELEVGADALFGQVVPPQAGSVTAHVTGLPDTVVEIDVTGYFVLRPIPAGPFRLRFRPRAGGDDVLTGWITP